MHSTWLCSPRVSEACLAVNTACFVDIPSRSDERVAYIRYPRSTLPRHGCQKFFVTLAVSPDPTLES